MRTRRVDPRQGQSLMPDSSTGRLQAGSQTLLSRIVFLQNVGVCSNTDLFRIDEIDYFLNRCLVSAGMGNSKLISGSLRTFQSHYYT